MNNDRNIMRHLSVQELMVGFIEENKKWIVMWVLVLFIATVLRNVVSVRSVDTTLSKPIARNLSTCMQRCGSSSAC